MNNKKPLYPLYPLFLKILAGYIPLIILLGIVADRGWKEYSNIKEVENDEHQLREKRILIYRAFGKLLDLSFSDSFFFRARDEQFQVYQAKNTEAIVGLDKLRSCLRDTLQAARIDTVCLLLMEKQQQISIIIGLQSYFTRVDSLMEVRIPAIVSGPELSPEDTNKPEKKPGFFAKLFRKKDRKSKYAKRKNDEKNEQYRQSSAGKVSSMLRSLHRDFHAQSKEYGYLMELQADNLHAKNMELNVKFSQLLYDLEQTATQAERGTKDGGSS